MVRSSTIQISRFFVMLQYFEGHASRLGDCLVCLNWAKLSFYVALLVSLTTATYMLCVCVCVYATSTPLYAAFSVIIKSTLRKFGKHILLEFPSQM